MKHFTVEKMIELIRSKIVWGSRQEVHILCQDKHFESVERIDNYWKLLTAFLERWEEKKLLVLAQVVDIANGVTTSYCSENIPSSEIVGWNVTTGYDTVWKGRERAKDEIYGSWGSSFRYLFNFKAEM